MIRLFTITIPFQQQLYTALVSMRQQGEDFCCQVRYIDEDLHQLLANGELTFNLSEGFKEPKDLPKNFTEALIQNTDSSICAFLKQTLS